MKLFQTTNMLKLSYIENELIRLHDEANEFEFMDHDKDRERNTDVGEAYKLIYAQIDKLNNAMLEIMKES